MVTLAPAPRDSIRIVVRLPAGGIGGRKFGSAFKAKATSEVVTWKGFLMKTGGSPTFWASTSMSYQPGPISPPQMGLGTFKIRVKAPLLSAAGLSGRGSC